MKLSGETGRRDMVDAENRRLRAELAAVRAVCAQREAELLALKGACSTASCALHRAHSGPCDIASASPSGDTGERPALVFEGDQFEGGRAVVCGEKVTEGRICAWGLDDNGRCPVHGQRDAPDPSGDTGQDRCGEGRT